MPDGGGRMVWSLVAAVVVLLVLVIGLVASPLVAPWLPQALGVAPSTERLEADLGTLQEKVATLETALADSRRTAEAAQDQAGQVADLRRTLDDLQRRVQALGGLTGQMDQLDRQVRAVAQPDAAMTGRIDGLESRAGDLHQRLEQVEAQAGPDPALQQRLDGIEGEVATVSRLADSIQRRMSGMDNALNSVHGQADGLERRMAGMDERIAAAARPAPELTEALATLRDRVSILDRDIATADARIGQLQTELEQVRAESRRVEDRESGRNRWYLLLLNLRQIEGSLDSGTAFAREVATLPELLGADLSADPEVRDALSVLRSQGRAGVASLDSLVDGFDARAAQALRQRPADMSEPGLEPGLWDRIVQGAAGLVSIRPVGEVPGDGPGAILARAESALAGRNLPRAVAEVEKLTGAQAEAMADWLQQAKARLSAIAALDRLKDAVATALLPAATGTAIEEAPAQPSPAVPAPATQAPATQAPATQAPATEAPATEAPPAPSPDVSTPDTPAPSQDAPADAPADAIPAPAEGAEGDRPDGDGARSSQ